MPPLVTGMVAECYPAGALLSPLRLNLFPYLKKDTATRRSHATHRHKPRNNDIIPHKRLVIFAFDRVGGYVTPLGLYGKTVRRVYVIRLINNERLRLYRTTPFLSMATHSPRYFADVRPILRSS